MQSTRSRFSFIPPRLQPSTVLVVASAFSICLLFDFALLFFIRAGPPTGKSDLFFVELAVLLSGLAILFGFAATAHQAIKTSLPVGFTVLAWHTGLQLQISDGLVLTAIDVLAPLACALALLESWHRRPAARLVAERLRLPMLVFAAFCLWGLGIALIRAVPAAPLLANLRSFAVYPLLALTLLWCITSWRQFYWTSSILLLCVIERALEGLRQGASAPATALLANGVLVTRINGNFAQVNQYALYIMTGLLVAAALLVAARTVHTRVALIALLGLLLYALIETYSRGAWLGAAAGVAALLFVLRLRRGAVVLLSFLGIAAVVQLIDPGLLSLVTDRITTRDHSIIQRQDWNTLALHVIENFPLGAGWGAAFFELPRGLFPAQGFPWYHNDYLQLATEIGVPGLAAFAWIWIRILRMGTRAHSITISRMQKGWLVGLTAALVGALVQAATDQFFWHADIAPHIWILAGLLLAGIALVYQDEQQRSPSEA